MAKKAKRMMTTKSEWQIKRTLANLRKIVDCISDPCDQRIAQAMETALRWATEDTKGWAHPDAEAIFLARILRNDLKRARESQVSA